MCLHKTYSKFRTGKYLSNVFHILNFLKQGNVLTPLPLKFILEYTTGKAKLEEVGFLMVTSTIGVC
jgi:hypothetical protein